MHVSSELLAVARDVRGEARLAAGAPGVRFGVSYLLTVLPLALAWSWLAARPSLAAWGIAALVAGFTQNAFGVLMHEGSHGFFAKRRAVNDVLADVLVCLPIFNTVSGYREPHLAHHRDCCEPPDPYFELYGAYRRRSDVLGGFIRDFAGVTAISAFLRRYSGRQRFGGAQAAALAGMQLGLGLLLARVTGVWWAWAVLWLWPLLTAPIAINRLRTFVEHFAVPGGEEANRGTVPTWVEYLLVAPYGYAHHFEHHLMPEVPYYRLAWAHRALVGTGAALGDAQLARDGYLRAFARLRRSLP